MVEPPSSGDVLTSLTNLMHFVTRETDHQFITFVDSRKQTEQLASVMRRNQDSDQNAEDLDYDVLERLQVHPFRAGYESGDRKRIQEKLQSGELRGVISTSALEMGIDLPWLTLGILYGIPSSATSYYQRIGRVGRHAEGTIIVVNNGSILSNRIFRQPQSLDAMPLAESALYLENPRILLFEAFLIEVPFERQDLRAAQDQFRVSRGSISKGQRFLCVYDQTYGSLRLTSRLMDPVVLRGVFDKARDIASNDDAFEVSLATLSALRILCESVRIDPVRETLSDAAPVVLDNMVLVILPGSVGLYPDYRNEEFRVDGLVYTPKGLHYKGKRLSQQGARFEEITVTAPVDKIVTIPGRSEMGCYDLDTGEITPMRLGTEQPDAEQSDAAGSGAITLSL